MNQGCYNGDDGVFAQKVGECSDSQADCIMGIDTGGENEEDAPLLETPLCKFAFVLLGCALFACRK